MNKKTPIKKNQPKLKGYIETEIYCLDCKNRSYILFRSNEMPTWVSRHTCETCKSHNTRVSNYWFRKRLNGKRFSLVHDVSYSTITHHNDWAGQGMVDSYDETTEHSRGWWADNYFVMDFLWFVML